MMSPSELKQSLLLKCKEYVETQISHIQAAIKGAQESSNSETKSSAGDKHETGKSHMQLEQEKNGMVLQRLIQQKKVFPYLEQHKNTGEITLGSLVETNLGWYYISIGIGILKMENENCFVVSPSSPIGKVLVGGKEGDKVSFNGKKIHVKNLF